MLESVFFTSLPLLGSAWPPFALVYIKPDLSNLRENYIITTLSSPTRSVLFLGCSSVIGCWCLLEQFSNFTLTLLFSLTLPFTKISVLDFPIRISCFRKQTRSHWGLTIRLLYFELTSSKLPSALIRGDKKLSRWCWDHSQDLSLLSNMYFLQII